MSGSSGPADPTTQYWLARLDQYGNPHLEDGAHSDRAGVEHALFLIQGMNLAKEGERWACARVELTDVEPKAKPDTDHEAVETMRGVVDWAQGRGEKPKL